MKKGQKQVLEMFSHIAKAASIFRLLGWIYDKWIA